MADFAKLTHVASEVEGNMLVGRLKDAGLQAFVQPSVSPVQGKLYTGELGMAASGADVCVAAERLEEAKGLLNQWNAIQPDEQSLRQSLRRPENSAGNLRIFGRDHKGQAAIKVK